MSESLNQKYDRIPEDVIDEVSYIEYLKLLADPILNEQRYHIASDGTSVDTIMGFSNIRKVIEHLEADEKAEIEKLCGLRRSVIAKSNAFKRKAFGAAHPKKVQTIDNHILSGKKAELLELFGRFYSNAEVHKICIDEYGIPVNLMALSSFKEMYAEDIKARQEDFKRDYSDLRLGHKRSRLDELHYLYIDRKQKYVKTSSRDDYKLLLVTIEQIRKEVEGDKLTITGDLNVNIEHTINLHIQKEIMKDLTIMDIVIGKIAARSNVNPRFFIAKLHNSYYRQFSGLGDTLDLQATPQYPSDQAYDMDKIRTLWKEKPKEVPSLMEPLTIAIPVEKEEEVNDIKAKLLQIIKRRKKEVEGMEVRAQGYSGANNFEIDKEKSNEEIIRGRKKVKNRDKPEKKKKNGSK